jgi:phage repressor protein C with HTH and peptisase S24 domain
MIDVNRIAENVRTRMVALGLTPKALSTKAGLNPTYVRDLFVGKSRNPRTEHIAKLASCIGCQVTDLTEEDADPRRDRPESEIPAALFIPELDVRAMGGDGADDAPLDGEGRHRVLAHWSLPVEYLQSFTPSPEAVRIIRIVGDSMEPNYPANERVMVDTSHRIPTPAGVYVLWDGFGLLLKHVEVLIGRTPPVADLQIQGRVMGKWLWK